MYKQKGKVIKVMAESGTSAKGEWNKTTVVIDNGSQYSNTVPYVFFGKTPQELAVSEGQEAEVSFYVGGREWNGKFFSDLKGESITIVDSKQEVKRSDAQNAHIPNVPQTKEEVEDDLPF